VSDDWFKRAACRGDDPDIYVVDPTGVQAQTTAKHNIALITCRRCPVSVECLKFALDHDERTGVWGCMTPRQRRRVKAAEKRGAISFETRDGVMVIVSHGSPFSL
jgi:WhiB family transcriptional regulator, redox-sensing transcriptional regulator